LNTLSVTTTPEIKSAKPVPITVDDGDRGVAQRMTQQQARRFRKCPWRALVRT